MGNSALRESRIRKLEYLLPSLASATNIKFIVGNSWHYNPARNEVSIDEKDIERCSLNCLFGILTHEVGHILITRYDRFSCINQPLWRELFSNVLEDTRVNYFMQQHFTGCKEWISQIYHFSNKCDQQLKPLSLQFIIYSLKEAHIDWKKNTTPSHELTQALNVTRHARRRLCQTIPKIKESGRHYSVDDYHQYRNTVWSELTECSKKSFLRSNTEQLIELRAWQSLQIQMDDIEPVFEQLLETDIGYIVSGMYQLPRLKILLKKAITLASKTAVCLLLDIIYGKLTFDADSDRQSPYCNEYSAVKFIAEQALYIYIGVRNPNNKQAIKLDKLPEHLTIDPSMFTDKPMAKIETIKNRFQKITNITIAGYNQLISGNKSQIARLSQQLKMLVSPVQVQQRHHLYSKGNKLNIKGVLRSRAAQLNTPNINIWQAQSIKIQQSNVISILCDCSGSMYGGKSQAAITGVAIVCEAAHLAKIPLAVYGFQDVLIPVKKFYQPFNHAVKQAITGLLLECDGSNPSGNNHQKFNDDGPCITKAVDELSAHSASNKILLVISDGVPEGRFSNENDLINAISYASIKGVHLIGLGIGECTEHINQFYPNGQGNVPIERFTQTLSSLILSAIKQDL